MKWAFFKYLQKKNTILLQNSRITMLIFFLESLNRSFKTKQMNDVCPSVCLSVRLSLKISETTEPIGIYSSGNIPFGPVVVFIYYFLGGWDTPNPPKNKKSPCHFFII